MLVINLLYKYIYINVSTKQNNYIYFYHANLEIGQGSYCGLLQWYQDIFEKQATIIEQNMQNA